MNPYRPRVHCPRWALSLRVYSPTFTLVLGRASSFSLRLQHPISHTSYTATSPSRPTPHPTTVSPPGDSLCLPPDLIFHYADRMFSTYSKSFLNPSECSLTILLRPGLCLFSTGLFPGYQMPQQLAKTTLLPRKICPRSLASVISSGNLSVTHPAQNWPF